MGKVVFIACTNVGRAMIEAVMNNPKLEFQGDNGPNSSANVLAFC